MGGHCAIMAFCESDLAYWIVRSLPLESTRIDVVGHEVSNGELETLRVATLYS